MAVGTVMFAALLTFTTTPALAAPAPDSPPQGHRGDQYHIATAKTHNIHAHDHARLLGKYAEGSEEPVPADVIQHHTQAIRKDTEKARQAFSRLSDSAKNNPAVAQQLAKIQQQLDKVTEMVNHLEGRSETTAIASTVVTEQMQALAEQMKATHVASKEIEQVFIQSLQQRDEFQDLQTSDYYFTGEGHFID